MVKLYTLLFSLVFVGQAHSQFLQEQQYFDGNDTIPSQTLNIILDTTSNNIWQIGPPQKTIFNQAASIPNVLITDTVNYLPDNLKSSFVVTLDSTIFSPPSPFGVLALQWAQKLDFDTSQNGGTIEVLYDTAYGYENIFGSSIVYNMYGHSLANEGFFGPDYGFTGTDATWKNIWLCFDLSWLSTLDTFALRYTAITHDTAATTKEGWMIDNFLIQETWVHTVKEIAQEDYLAIAPNPATERVEIKLKRSDEFHIIEKLQVFDASGKLMEERRNLPIRYTLDLSSYPKGVYIVKVQSNLKEDQVKLIVD